MYSRKSYNNGQPEKEEEYVITPPPGYDGSRFGMRSDGRDDAFPPYNSDAQVINSRIYDMEEDNKDNTEKIECDCNDDDSEHEKERRGIMQLPIFKKGIGHEELLIIALIIILASEKSNCGELILMLAILLCV